MMTITVPAVFIKKTLQVKTFSAPQTAQALAEAVLNTVGDVPAYADDAAAILGGLKKGQIYQVTGSGTVTIVQ